MKTPKVNQIDLSNIDDDDNEFFPTEWLEEDDEEVKSI